jgi:hypothetical protein
MSKKKDKNPGDDFMDQLLKGKKYDLTNKVIHNFEPITKESMDKSKLADVQKGEDGITRVNIGGATYATDGEVGEEYYKDGEYPEEKGVIKPPSVWQMAKNFSKEVAKYVAEGAPNVSQEDYEARLAACDACPHLMREKMRCGLCGCMLETKARWRTTTCPDDPTRWAKQDPTPKTEQEKAKHEEARVKRAEWLKTPDGEKWLAAQQKTAQENKAKEIHKQSQEYKEWVEKDPRRADGYGNFPKHISTKDWKRIDDANTEDN